jgi:integrase
VLDSSHMKGRGIVHISDLLLVALTEAREWTRSEYVVEYRGRRAGDVKKVRQAGCGSRRSAAVRWLHACRHELATRALNEGVNMQKISRALGHKNVRTTEEIYARARARLTREVVEVTSLPLTFIERGSGSMNRKTLARATIANAKIPGRSVVGATGIEPVTPTMSR